MIAALVGLGTAPTASARPPLGGVGDLTDLKTGLADRCPLPEGVAVDPRDGTVFASSLGALRLLPAWGFTQPTGPGSVCVVGRSGTVRTLPVAPGPSGTVALFGMDFVPGEGLYVGDGADSLTNPASTATRLLLIDPATGRTRTVLSGVGAPIGVLRHGRWLYVADGLRGRILRMRPDGSAVRTIADSPLLRPAEGSPYGANGLAVDPSGRRLYVPNPGTSRVLTVALRGASTRARVRVFVDAERVNRRERTKYAAAAPDDVAVDRRGNVWITCNDGEEIEAFSPQGRLVARVRGLGVNATRNPTALAFRGRDLIVTNFDARSATPGANSKLSVVRTPYPGLRD